MKTVKNIIDKKAKISNIVSPDTLVIDALKMMIDINLSYLIVMDGEKYKGIFSERDYSRNVVLKGRSSITTAVQEVMATDLPVVHPAQTAEHCMNILSSSQTRYLVCLDSDENFKGVVTIHDLIRLVLADKADVFGRAISNYLNYNDDSGKVL
ncbi:MAG: CBS domain-containing protein [Ginsengibacter sp.]